MQQIGYDLQTWIDYRLSFVKCFFLFYQHTRYVKRGKEKRLFAGRVIYD